jgi:hypothetical protein
LQRKNGATIFHQLQKLISFIESDFMSFERTTQHIPTFYFTPFLLVMSPVQCFFDRKHFFTFSPADLTQGIVATPQGAGGRGPTNQKASGLQTCTHPHKHISTHTYTQKHIKTHTNTHKHLHQIFHVLRYLQSTHISQILIQFTFFLF